MGRTRRHDDSTTTGESQTLGEEWHEVASLGLTCLGQPAQAEAASSTYTLSSSGQLQFQGAVWAIQLGTITDLEPRAEFCKALYQLVSTRCFAVCILADERELRLLLPVDQLQVEPGNVPVSRVQASRLWLVMRTVWPGLSPARTVEISEEHVGHFVMRGVAPMVKLEQPPGLQAVLRPYQQAALEFMTSRERGVQFGRRILPPTWIELATSGGPLFYAPTRGQFSRIRPAPDEPILGGILADEVGLGKTVEIIALICASARPCVPLVAPPRAADLNHVESTALDHLGNVHDKRCWCGLKTEADKPTAPVVHCATCGWLYHAACVGLYVPPQPKAPTAAGKPPKRRRVDSVPRIEQCPLCETAGLVQPLVSQATLIVCPKLLLHQWAAEVRNHSNLKCLVYPGIKHIMSTAHSNPGAVTMLSPALLGSQDVVLTTYEVLLEVQDFLQDAQRDAADSPPFPPSPLRLISWWRLVLDEAQTVNGFAARTTKSACEIDAVNRWCVSGTPLKRDVGDFIGLFHFLQVPALSNNTVWKQVINDPTMINIASAALQRVVRPMMWRNTKADVADQMRIPPQTTEMVHVGRDAAEEISRHLSIARVSAPAVRLITRWVAQGDRDANPSVDDMRCLADILQRALFHTSYPRLFVQDAQAARRSRASRAALQEGSDILVTHLQQQARNKLGAAVRKAIALRQDAACDRPQDAQRLLTEARDMIADHEAHCNVSSYLQVQITNELLELVKANGQAAAAPVSVDGLVGASRALEQQHLTRAVNDLVKASHKWLQAMSASANPSTRDLAALQHMLQRAAQSAVAVAGFEQVMAWITRALALVPHDPAVAREFLEAVKQDKARGEAPNLDDELAYTQQLVSALVTELQAAYAKIFLDVAALFIPSEDVFRASLDCRVCKRSLERTGPECAQCKARRTCDALSSTLRSLTLVQPMELDKFDACDRILWLAAHVGDEMPNQVTVRAYFGALFRQVMACSHLCRAEEDFLGHKGEISFLPVGMQPIPAASMQSRSVDFSAVDQQVQFAADNLASTQSLQAVPRRKCKCEAAKRGLPAIHVWPCGHWSCQTCTAKALSLHNSFECFDCHLIYTDETAASALVPMYRHGGPDVAPAPARVHDFTGLLAGTEGQWPELPTCAVLDTKVRMMLRALLFLSQTKENPKVLVFSQYPAALAVVNEHLDTLNIGHALIKSASGPSQELLDQFRTDAALKVLLLPVRLTCQGLNLVEASHILFMEPVTAAWSYLQATARIHRFSQTRPTFVHTFVVRDSVEELVHFFTLEKAQRYAGSTIPPNECTMYKRGELIDMLSIIQMNATAASVVAGAAADDSESDADADADEHADADADADPPAQAPLPDLPDGGAAAGAPLVPRPAAPARAIKSE